ncbi:MAG: tetratricopeptide repeat protein [Spirochaetales bacterium]|nr:tetratricopeptide repeat protein [Spirochaetales bacterium]
MGSLYQRALHFLNQEQLDSFKIPEGIEFEDGSGISIEEQKEILSHIEEIVSQNRITVSDDIFSIKPKKRGVLFPFVLNIIAILIVVAAFLGIQYFFNKQEQEIKIESSSYSSQEGQLIRDIKKEAEDKLNEKNSEIIQIQEQLKNLDSEKAKLQETMDDEIVRKQQELERLMAEEIDKKKAELEAQGLSTAEIDSQLDEIEMSYNRELASFKAKAEEDLREKEANLERIKNDYNTQLTTLSNEKARLQEEYAKREKEAREREAALEREITETETRLAEMTAQREKENLYNDQILGMYSDVNLQLKGNRFDAALNSLDKMRDFFNNTAIATLPTILKRRNVELFIIDSLEKLIEFETAKADIDTSSLLEKANIISSISARVEAADRLYRENRIDEAQVQYREALAIIPEIKKSYENLLAIQSSRTNEQFALYFRQGNSLFSSRDYQGAINSYKNAIKLFSSDPFRVETMVTNLIESGYRLQGDSNAVVEDEKAANQLLSKATGALRTNDYETAIDAYIEILTKYPRTPQVQSARNGIKNTIIKEKEAALADTDSRIAEKNALLAEKDATISELQAILDENVEAKEKEALLKEKNALIAEKNKTIEEQNALINEKNGRIAELEAYYYMNIETQNAMIAEKEAALAQKDAKIAELETLLDRNADARGSETLIAEKDRLIKEKNTLIAEKDAALAEKDEQIAELNALLKQKDSEISRLNTVERELTNIISRLEKEKKELSAELAAMQERAESPSATQPPWERTGDTAMSAEETRAYEELKTRIEALKKRYREYMAMEDRIVAEQGSIGYLTTKPLLGDILNSEFAKEIFPDLYARLKKFDTALAEDARKDGEYIVMDRILNIIYDRMTLGSTERPEEYWNEMRKEYSEEPLFLELIEEISTLMDK